MPTPERRQKLFDSLIDKGTLKQEVFKQTYKAFLLFKDVLLELYEDYEDLPQEAEMEIPVEYSEKGQFEVQLKFAGDVLVFMMHTNVFESSPFAHSPILPIPLSQCHPVPQSRRPKGSRSQEKSYLYTTN